MKRIGPHSLYTGDSVQGWRMWGVWLWRNWFVGVCKVENEQK